jgi:hypothetical protein
LAGDSLYTLAFEVLGDIAEPSIALEATEFSTYSKAMEWWEVRLWIWQNRRKSDDK